MKQPTPFARAGNQTKTAKENPAPSVAPPGSPRDAHAVGYCFKCSKIAWGSFAKAHEEALKIKAWPNVNKPHLIHAYRCPHGNAFHVGHNFKTP